MKETEQVKKKTWRRGRVGFCNGEKGIRYTTLLCPYTRDELQLYSKEIKKSASHVVNQAIQFYIQYQIKSDKNGG